MTQQGWGCVCGAYGLQGTWCPYCGRWAPWYAPYVPPPPPPRVGLDLRGKVLAGLVAFVLVAGVARVGAVTGAERRAREAAIAAVVAELSAYVEQVHGAPFKSKVRVRLVSEESFEDEMYAGEEYVEEDDDAPPADFDATMAALGMSDPGERGDDGTAEDVFDADGFYDQGTKAIYVLGRAITPVTRLILVHELVHAWQDQHHDLQALDEKAEDDDHYAAIQALVEGDATRVEELWRAEQSAADLAIIEAYENEGDDEVLTREERTLATMFSFPYVVGADFATAVHERGGNVALTNAYASPPTSTEQVLHPELYFAEHPPVEVDAPDPDGEPVDEGVLGELGLYLLLARGTPSRAALTTASGWAGDAYVTWEDVGVACTEARIKMDTARARDRLVTSLRESATQRQEVFVRGADEVELRYCADAPVRR